MIKPTPTLSPGTANSIGAARSFVPPSCHGPWPKKQHENVFLGFAVGVVSVPVLGQNDRKRTLRGSVLISLIISVLFFGSCGGSLSAPASVGSSSGQTAGATLHNVQASGGWKGWGELAPAYEICSSCSPQVTWAMTQTGVATQFDIGGTVPYSDVLWSNPVIGQGSTQGLPDLDETLVPNSGTSFMMPRFFPTTCRRHKFWSLTSANISTEKLSFLATSAASPADMNGISGTT